MQRPLTSGRLARLFISLIIFSILFPYPAVSPKAAADPTGYEFSPEAIGPSLSEPWKAAEAIAAQYPPSKRKNVKIRLVDFQNDRVEDNVAKFLQALEQLGFKELELVVVTEDAANADLAEAFALAPDETEIARFEAAHQEVTGEPLPQSAKNWMVGNLRAGIQKTKTFFSRLFGIRNGVTILQHFIKVTDDWKMTSAFPGIMKMRLVLGTMATAPGLIGISAMLHLVQGVPVTDGRFIAANLLLLGWIFGFVFAQTEVNSLKTQGRNYDLAPTDREGMWRSQGTVNQRFFYGTSILQEWLINTLMFWFVFSSSWGGLFDHLNNLWLGIQVAYSYAPIMMWSQKYADKQREAMERGDEAAARRYGLIYQAINNTWYLLIFPLIRWSPMLFSGDFSNPDSWNPLVASAGMFIAGSIGIGIEVKKNYRVMVERVRRLFDWTTGKGRKERSCPETIQLILLPIAKSE